MSSGLPRAVFAPPGRAPQACGSVFRPLSSFYLPTTHLLPSQQRPEARGGAQRGTGFSASSIYHVCVALGNSLPLSEPRIPRARLQGSHPVLTAAQGRSKMQTQVCPTLTPGALNQPLGPLLPARLRLTLHASPGAWHVTGAPLLKSFGHLGACAHRDMPEQMRAAASR